MFHKAVDLEFKDGTEFELTFSTGEVKCFDMASLIDKYPAISVLNNRNLFLSGKLSGGYGIIWNDEIDIEAETVYEEGTLVRTEKLAGCHAVADALLAARAKAGMSQAELSAASGIDQSDISKIERGLANPSVQTLSRLANGLGAKLEISFSTQT